MKIALEVQKEVEKMIKKISDLEEENSKLVKENRMERDRDNKIKRSLLDEVDKYKKQNLELIRENNKINKKLNSYIKVDRNKNEIDLANFEKLTEEEKWQQYEENDTYDDAEYDAYAKAMAEMDM